MGAVHWVSTQSGDWSTAADWQGDAVPNDSEVVEIGGFPPNDFTITVSAAAEAYQLLVANAYATIDDRAKLSLDLPLIISAGDFVLDTAGALQWNEGSPTIAIYGGGEFQTKGARTLNELTVRLGVGYSASAIFDFSMLTIGATAKLDLEGASNAAAPSIPTMAGTALINRGLIYAYDAADVTITATIIRNHLHIIDQSLSTFTLEARSIVNSGDIQAAGSGGATISASGWFVNDGAVDDSVSLTIETDNLVLKRSIVLNATDTTLTLEAEPGGRLTTYGSSGIGILGSSDTIKFIGDQRCASNGITVVGDEATLEISGVGDVGGALTIASKSKFYFDSSSAQIVGGPDVRNVDKLINFGTLTILVTDASLDISCADFINQGFLVEGDQQQVVIRSAVSGEGLIEFGDASTTEFAGPVASPQILEFNFAHETLKLDAPASFAGQLYGFQSDDRADLVGFKATSATWSDNVLTVGNAAGANLSLTIKGAYGPNDFVVVSDLAGGSYVELKATSGALA